MTVSSLEYPSVPNTLKDNKFASGATPTNLVWSEKMEPKPWHMRTHWSLFPATMPATWVPWPKWSIGSLSGLGGESGQSPSPTRS